MHSADDAGSTCRVPCNGSSVSEAAIPAAPIDSIGTNRPGTEVAPARRYQQVIATAGPPAVGECSPSAPAADALEKGISPDWITKKRRTSLESPRLTWQFRPSTDGPETNPPIRAVMVEGDAL